MLIGITGGIGSGKSTIARALKARGFTVYDCDHEAKRIIAGNKEVQQKIIALLGPESFVHDTLSPCTYNTVYVAKRVFADPSLLNQLNSIIHPAVKQDIQQFSINHSQISIIFIESAILFEAGLDSLCDKIILVEAPEEVRISRTIARDYHGNASSANINKVRARIHAQETSIPSYSVLPTMTVQNDGSISIEEIVEKITHWM